MVQVPEDPDSILGHPSGMLMLDKDFDPYLPALEMVKDDLKSLVMALEPVRK